jgi:anti-anti-sigma regulatory factor
MAAAPFSALCAYNSAELDEQTIAQLACLHRTTNTSGPGFRLHAASMPGCVAAVAGELDTTNWDLFARVLQRIEPRPDADPGTLVVDGTGLTFIDHHSLLQLAEYAQHHGATLVLRTSWPGAARIVTTLNLPRVRIEPAP